MFEDMFNPVADLRFAPVELELHFTQRTISRGLLVDKILDTQLDQSLVDARTLVGAVDEKVLALVVSVAINSPKRLESCTAASVIWIVSNDLRIGIGFHVVLVAEMLLLVFLGPKRIHAFLTELARLSFPRCGHLALLDHLVFLPRVTLTRHIDKTRVDDGSSLGDHAVCFEDRVECIEQRPDRLSFSPRLPKLPHRGKIRHRAARMRPRTRWKEHRSLI